MGRIFTVVAMVAAMVFVSVPGAFAAGATDQETRQAAGWGCGEAVGLPAGHCISPGTIEQFAKIAEKGLTFQVQMFDEAGDFLTAEVATFEPSADDRACPHDPESPDGTYWAFVEGVLWVCHHQPE